MVHESVTAVVDRAPEPVFARLVDVAGLPVWNDAITEVVASPSEMVTRSGRPA